MCDEVAKIHSKNKFSIHDIVKEKEILTNFAVAPMTTKVMATVIIN